MARHLFAGGSKHGQTLEVSSAAPIRFPISHARSAAELFEFQVVPFNPPETEFLCEVYTSRRIGWCGLGRAVVFVCDGLDEREESEAILRAIATVADPVELFR